MLVRAEPAGISVYMTRRSSRSRFMPDAYVFPGGAVDPADGDPALRSRLCGDSGIERTELAVAALRELLEEAGVLLACDDTGGSAAVAPPVLATIRADLLAGEPFAGLLERHGLRLDVGALSYYSNWITPVGEPIRFDAHFFLAVAPPEQVAAADAIEVHDGQWFSPREALARADREEIIVRFPTRKHLERLAAYDDVGALVEHARGRRFRPVMPVLGSRDDVIVFEEEDSW